MSITPIKALIMATILTAAGAAGGETITLQQGQGGYAGCTVRTIETTFPPKDQPADHFALRGSQYQMHVKFDLPADLAGKTVARAQLMVFLPAASKANAFTEIFCHEVVTGGRQPSCDEVTDYANGRRAGAVDSESLFASAAGNGWLKYPWLPLDVPEGGKWIAFNVTPLVAKWRSGQSANYGVMLWPTDRPDGREKSTWEIDIPSAGGKDADKRPKLVIETAPVKEDLLVGVTDAMQSICDRSPRYAYRGSYGSAAELAMAQNEFEGFQLVVYPMLKDLADVMLAVSDLKGPEGKAIPAADVEWFVVDSYQLLRNWMTGSIFGGGKLYEAPDPLVPARPTLARRHVHTPFFVRVRTRPDTPAGTYKGTVAVMAGKDKLAAVDLSVRVWPVAIPTQWNFHTMGQYIWENCEKFHGKDWSAKLARTYYDFLLDHRFAPVEQYRQTLSPRTDIPYCRQRGMNTIYLYSVHGGRDQPGKELAERIRPDYEKVRDLGALDDALVYIGDETSQWDRMHGLADVVHAYLPGAQVMIGGSFPRQELIGYIDIYDPQIGGGNKVYSLQQEAAGLISESQKRGEEFYWYVAAGPEYPWPNVQVEYPPVDSRVLFWMTWKYGVTGFEYYCYNIWQRNYVADPAQRYPNVKWKADGWEKGWPSNGDGMLFYPGPISSLRFEAIRDGIEDWEMLRTLADCITAVKGRKQPGKYKDLVARAEKMLAVDPEVVVNFKDFTRDPSRLLAERSKLGELLSEFVAAVDALPEKWDANQMSLGTAREVRIARQTALRRKMLRERHLAACQRLKVEPIDQAAWDALWPKRVLFAQDFEGEMTKAHDWEGEIVTDNVPPGGKRALAGDAKNKYYARATRTGIYFDNARAATTTWVSFKYFLSKPAPMTVFVFDMNQSDNWQHTIAEPVVGKWTEVTLNVTDDFRKKGGGSAKVRAGDGLDDVFVFAGKPGEDLMLIVDDVKLVGRD